MAVAAAKQRPRFGRAAELAFRCHESSSKRDLPEREGASVVITLDTYSHAIPATQETAAELVASLVFDDS